MKFMIVLVITLAFIGSAYGECSLLRGLRDIFERLEEIEKPNLPVDYVGTLFYDAAIKLKGSKFFRNTILAIAEQLNDFENDMLDINHKKVKLDKNKFTKEQQIELGKLFKKFTTAAPRLRESLLKFIDDLDKLDSIIQIPAILTKEMQDATIDLIKLIKEIVSKKVKPNEFIPRTTKFLTEMKLNKAILKDIHNSHKQFLKMVIKRTVSNYSDYLFN